MVSQNFAEGTLSYSSTKWYVAVAYKYALSEAALKFSTKVDHFDIELSAPFFDREALLCEKFALLENSFFL